MLSPALPNPSSTFGSIGPPTKLQLRWPIQSEPHPVQIG